MLRSLFPHAPISGILSADQSMNLFHFSRNMPVRHLPDIRKGDKNRKDKVPVDRIVFPPARKYTMHRRLRNAGTFPGRIPHDRRNRREPSRPRQRFPEIRLRISASYRREHGRCSGVLLSRYAFDLCAGLRHFYPSRQSGPCCRPSRRLHNPGLLQSDILQFSPVGVFHVHVGREFP